MKRSVAAVVLTALVACFAFALCACSEPYNPDASMKESTVDPAALKEAGVLHVGVNSESYPLAGQANGNMSGIDVDIASALAQEMGLKVAFVDVGADGVKALSGDEVDMVMGLESASAKGKCWTSDGYAPSCISLFSMDAEAKLPKRDDGQLVAAQTSSLSAWLVTRNLGEGALQAEDDVKAVFQQLSDGAVPYAAADAVVGLYVIGSMGIDGHLVGVMQDPDTYCIGIAEQNADLQTAVTEAMSSIQSNGIFDVILQKWTGGPVDLSAVPSVG